MGNNEVLGAWLHWGWQDKFGLTKIQADSLWENYSQLFYEVLPQVIREEDPSKFYWPSSPSSSRYEQEKEGAGDSHFWSIWFGEKEFEEYGAKNSRFVSEFGFQSFPEIKTLQRIITDSAEFAINSTFMQSRQRSQMPWIGDEMNGNLMIEKYMSRYYGSPKSFKDFVYVSQLLQADALKRGVELFKSQKPFCMGALYWQINDCWPAISWSTTDYFGNRKAAHYAVKRAFNPLIMVTRRDKGMVKTTLISDNKTPTPFQTNISYRNLNNEEIWKVDTSGIIPANGKIDILSINMDTAEFSNNYLYLTLRSNEETSYDTFYFLPYIELQKLGTPVIDIKVNALRDNKYTVLLNSSGLARGIRLTSSIPGQFSDNYFDLPPNEKKTITFSANETDEVPTISIKTLADVQWEN